MAAFYDDPNDTNDPYGDWEEVYTEETADPTDYDDTNLPWGTHIEE